MGTQIKVKKEYPKFPSTNFFKIKNNNKKLKSIVYNLTKKI